MSSGCTRGYISQGKEQSGFGHEEDRCFFSVYIKEYLLAVHLICRVPLLAFREGLLFWPSGRIRAGQSPRIWTGEMGKGQRCYYSVLTWD